MTDLLTAFVLLACGCVIVMACLVFFELNKRKNLRNVQREAAAKIQITQAMAAVQAETERRAAIAKVLGEQIAADTPVIVKRPRGRPKGSKDKAKRRKKKKIKR